MKEGITTISHRHVVANNPLVEGYDSSRPTSCITYLNVNNMYGNPLPVGNFQFLSQDKIQKFDLLSISLDNDTGYIIKC